jgi:general secretion pathway protein J
VLVAVGIFAIFSVIAYGGLLRMLDSRERIEQERELWRAMALAFLQMEDDLAQARARTVRDAYGQNLPAFHGQPTDIRALAEPSLELTRGGVAVFGDGPRADLQRAGYRLKDSTLVRTVWPALDRPPVTEPREYPLLDGVAWFEARFYASGRGWVDRWPTDDKPGVLPDAVEVTIEMPGRGRFQRVLLVGR